MLHRPTLIPIQILRIIVLAKLFHSRSNSRQCLIIIPGVCAHEHGHARKDTAAAADIGDDISVTGLGRADQVRTKTRSSPRSPRVMRRSESRKRTSKVELRSCRDGFSGSGSCGTVSSGSFPNTPPSPPAPIILIPSFTPFSSRLGLTSCLTLIVRVSCQLCGFESPAVRLLLRGVYPPQQALTVFGPCVPCATSCALLALPLRCTTPGIPGQQQS